MQNAVIETRTMSVVSMCPFGLDASINQKMFVINPIIVVSLPS